MFAVGHGRSVRTRVVFPRLIVTKRLAGRRRDVRRAINWPAFCLGKTCTINDLKRYRMPYVCTLGAKSRTTNVEGWESDIPDIYTDVSARPRQPPDGDTWSARFCIVGGGPPLETSWQTQNVLSDNNVSHIGDGHDVQNTSSIAATFTYIFPASMFVHRKFFFLYSYLWL